MSSTSSWRRAVSQRSRKQSSGMKLNFLHDKEFLTRFSYIFINVQECKVFNLGSA